MDSSPGICTNTVGCDLAAAGGPIFIELGEDFRCPQCGCRLIPPALPEPNRSLRVSLLAAAALLLGVTASVAGLYAHMHWKLPDTIEVAQLSSTRPLSIAPARAPPAPAPPPQAAAPPPATTAVIVPIPDRPFRPTPIHGGAPPYPGSLAADGRPGRVLVKCDILPTGKPTRCTARPERGGPAFPPAVLTWLQGKAVFAPIRLHGRAVRQTHTWQIAVAENPLALSRARRLANALPPQPNFNGVPTTSTRPDFPDEYAEQDRHGSLTVNCIIATDGHATDCHAAQTTGGPRFADAVMAWLANPRTKFPPLVRHGQYIAARRTWNVEYIP